MPDLRAHPLRPILLDAHDAHATGRVTYSADGVVTLRDAGEGLPREVTIPLERQIPLVRATLDDLNKALSRLASSPVLEGGRTLRAEYEDEVARYEALAAEAYGRGEFEPGYGTYVYDRRAGDLYLVAPARWHKLALVASQANLVADPDEALPWRDVRARLEGAVIGFAGVSVGGNLLEGWLREARPRAVKVADPDWVELTNLNRGERMSLRHAGESRAARFDPRSPYEVGRVGKAAYVAYEAQLVDPYLDVWVYPEGLGRGTISSFLAGDGEGEPPIDVLVEEMDNLELKLLVREEARARGVDVLMLSDFGHSADLMWNHFRAHPSSRLGVGASDADLYAAYERARGGDRAALWAFVEALCGPGYATDTFRSFVEGRGEQPTASLPQSGATAMASGAIGGKELALHVLGHHAGEPSPRRVVYDLMRRRAVVS